MPVQSVALAGVCALALAAPTFVQSAEVVQSSQSAAKAFTGASTRGDVIVVTLAWGSTNAATVTDSAGNTYVAAAQPTVGIGGLVGEQIQLFWAPVLDAGTAPLTVRATSPSSSYVQFAALEYRGVALSGPVDGVASGRSSGSTAIDAGPIVVTSADQVLVGWIYSTGTVSQGTPGFTVRSRINADLAQDRLATGPGTYIVTGSNASSQSWTMQVVGFRSALDAGAPDAGAPDAGGPDAGAGDAGAVPDAGGSRDSGAGDAGALDGGTNGPQGPGEYVVGCGCRQPPGAGGAAALGWLVVWGLAARRRATPGGVSASR